MHTFMCQVTAYDEQIDAFTFVDINAGEDPEKPTEYLIPAGLFAKLIGESGEPQEFVGAIWEIDSDDDE